MNTLKVKVCLLTSHSFALTHRVTIFGVFFIVCFVCIFTSKVSYQKMTFFKICMILWATLVLSFAFHIKSDSKSRHIHQKQQSSIIPKQHQKQDNFHQTKYFKSTSSSIHAKFQDVDVVSTEDESEYKSDLVKSSLLVGAAMAFAGGIAMLKGQPSAVEFLSGYLLELCLSVDNLIVFILLFDSFQVKKVDQTRVLNYGILGAVLLRGIFILAGSVAIDNFKQVLLLFAGILLYSSYQVLFQGEEEEEVCNYIYFCFIISDVVITTTSTTTTSNVYLILLFICIIFILLSRIYQKILRSYLPKNIFVHLINLTAATSSL